MPIPVYPTKHRKLTIEFKASPGDNVKVKNYKRKGIWETGTCTSTSIGIIPYPELKTFGQYVVSYRVKLDRVGNTARPLYLHVRDDGIENINIPMP